MNACCGERYCTCQPVPPRRVMHASIDPVIIAPSASVQIVFVADYPSGRQQLSGSRAQRKAERAKLRGRTCSTERRWDVLGRQDQIIVHYTDGKTTTAEIQSILG